MLNMVEWRQSVYWPRLDGPGFFILAGWAEHWFTAGWLVGHTWVNGKGINELGLGVCVYIVCVYLQWMHDENSTTRIQRME